MHHDDAVRHGHGFDLIVSDVNRRGLQALVQLLDLGAHLDAQLGVEVRQRLIEQEHLRVARDGAPHGDALALAARELARVALEQMLQSQNFGRLHHARVDLLLRRIAQPQREAHVGPDRHVRIKRVVLEHHGDVALFRRHVVDHAIADADLAAGDVLEPGNHAQQGRLAAA